MLVQSDGPLVGVVMGSDSDWPVMEAAAEVLDDFGVTYEADVVSAHRMPREMIAYGEQAASRGLRVIIAGAGGAAHLPGMLASVTPLPVIGVPVPLKYLDGMDSLLSIAQMPAGIPVATVAIGGARNAGLLAVRILGAASEELRTQMIEFQARLTAQAKAKGDVLRELLSTAGGDPPAVLEFPGCSSNFLRGTQNLSIRTPGCRSAAGLIAKTATVSGPQRTDLVLALINALSPFDYL